MAISNTHYQSAYSVQPAGLVGEVADQNGNNDFASRINGEASASIAAGLAVMRDSSAKETKVKAVAGTSPELLGVAVASTRQSADNSDNRTYAAGDDIRILTQGTAWMEAAGTLAAGDAVYIVNTGADQGKPGPASLGGTYPGVTLTWNKALAAGQARIERMTFDADLVTSNVFNCDVFGTAIDAITFNTSHDVTMGQIVDAIIEAGADNLLSATLSDQAGNNRTIDVVSFAFANTAILTNSVVTAGASQAGVTEAAVQTGYAPASFSCTVDGDTIGPVVWSGSHDDTMQNIAAQLAGHSKVASAVVTIDEDAFDPTITLTGANYAADDIDVASATVTGGEATPATVTVDNEATPGVAQTAVLWADAGVVVGGTDGETVKISVAVLPKP